MSKNIVGNRMRIARAMSKPPMSQADLLARLQINGWEVSQSTLSKIENGDREVSDFELVTIAKSLNVDILWLLGEKETTI